MRRAVSSALFSIAGWLFALGCMVRYGISDGASVAQAGAAEFNAYYPPEKR